MGVDWLNARHQCCSEGQWQHFTVATWRDVQEIIADSVEPRDHLTDQVNNRSIRCRGLPASTVWGHIPHPWISSNCTIQAHLYKSLQNTASAAQLSCFRISYHTRDSVSCLILILSSICNMMQNEMTVGAISLENAYIASVNARSCPLEANRMLHSHITRSTLLHVLAKLSRQFTAPCV